MRHWKVIFIGKNVEDSPPRLAGELASYKFHKHIYQLLSHLETKPPSLLSNRAVGRVLLSHCLFPYLLCYGGIKQKQWVKGGHSTTDLQTVVTGLSLCSGHSASSLQSAHSQPLLSDLPAPSVHRAHSSPGGPQQKDHGAPRATHIRGEDNWDILLKYKYC